MFLILNFIYDLISYVEFYAHSSLFFFCQAMKVAKKLKTNTVSGYSNDSNPFGDSNLNEKYVSPLIFSLCHCYFYCLGD